VQLRFGVHFDGWNKGFDLSPEIGRALAERHVRVGFDLYAYGEDDA
jgi:hypothetical protein